jgi:hypothetical protein
MCVLRERAHRIIDSISDKRIEQILDYLEYIRIKEELEATEEIVNDQKLMASIQKGIQELKAGEIFSLDEMKNV